MTRSLFYRHFKSMLCKQTVLADMLTISLRLRFRITWLCVQNCIASCAKIASCTAMRRLSACNFQRNFEHKAMFRDAGTMWRQGGADFRERALLNWLILRDVCKTSGVELCLIMFSIYWMIGVWGGSPPGDCATLSILEARWLHFLRFLKQIRKRIALTFLSIRYFAKAIL
jgi:hypothetical protein